MKRIFEKLVICALALVLLCAVLPGSVSAAAKNATTTSISKVQSKAKGFKITWKKKGKIKGYQIQYSTSKTFKNAKAKTVSNSKTTSVTISKLAGCNKKYYVRIRTYTVSGGKKVYSAWSNVKAVSTANHSYAKATCTEAKTCKYCDKTAGKALGHKWKAATCTKAKTCTVCKKAVGKAIGHKWKAATCAKAKTCTVCKKTSGKALGHKYNNTTVKPTCTKEGYTEHVCSRCGNSYRDNKKSAKGHNYEVIDDTATCTESGYKTEECSRCGNEKVTSSKALGHSKTTTKTKKASCVAEGYTKVICKICDEVISNTVIPAKGQHTFKTMRLSKAAKKSYENGSYSYVKYMKYTDWNVKACDVCWLIDLDTMAFAYTPQEAAEIMLGYVNELRESVYGTDEYNLKLDSSLIKLANKRAKEISEDFSHNGSPIDCGENIAVGYVNIYDDFIGWKNSKGHYANMIDKNCTIFGYGFYFTNTNLMYSVQTFK